MPTKIVLKKGNGQKATVKKVAPTNGKAEALGYEDKVALANKAKKVWDRMDDDVSKTDVKAFFDTYMTQLGYKPLCRIIRGSAVLVKAPKEAE